MKSAFLRCLEARGADLQGGDRLIRRTARAATLDAVRCGGGVPREEARLRGGGGSVCACGAFGWARVGVCGGAEGGGLLEKGEAWVWVCVQGAASRWGWGGRQRWEVGVCVHVRCGPPMGLG